MPNVKKVRALELVKDWNLWPRYETNDLDSTNVRRLKDALIAGEVLPPIIADKNSYRIIDGFHRTAAYLSVYGDEVEIYVEFRKYKSDVDMFLAAARYNTIHGLPLSPKDKIHVILTARRKRVSLTAIGKILGMTKEEVAKFEKRRTAVTNTGEKIPLAAGAMSLAGKTLTNKQEKFARTSNGVLPIVNARLLINALNASACPLTGTEVSVLTQLRDAINIALADIEMAVAS